MEGFGSQQHDQHRHQQGTDQFGSHVQPGHGGQQGVLGGQQQHQQHKDQSQGIGSGISSKLHRSNSSSSSSESDGEGGRRKKGIKDKIKEKLPGQHNQGQTGQHGMTGGHQQGMTGMTGGHQQGYGATGQHGEQEGMMDKIKDKLSGNQ